MKESSHMMSHVSLATLNPRGEFIAALERRPPTGRVPHFELVFFLILVALLGSSADGRAEVKPNPPLDVVSGTVSPMQAGMSEHPDGKILSLIHI